MNKKLKVSLIIFCVFAVIVGSLAIWQWKNIESIYIGINETESQIEKRRADNQTSLISDINNYLESPLRDMTPEEKTQVEKGEVSVTDIYTKMFEEKQEEVKITAESNPPPDIKKSKDESPKPSKDEIVSKYMIQLYTLQSEFTAKAETTIMQGESYYLNLRKTQDKTVAMANTIKHFTPIVRSVEANCDSKVENVITNLENELRDAKENTDITVAIRNTYKNEKQLKLSYYANKYLT